MGTEGTLRGRKGSLEKLEENTGAFRGGFRTRRSGYIMDNIEFLTQGYIISEYFISKLSYSSSGFKQ